MHNPTVHLNPVPWLKQLWCNFKPRSRIPPRLVQKAARFQIRLIRSLDALPFHGKFYPALLPAGNARLHQFLAIVCHPGISETDLEKAIEDCAAYFGLQPALPGTEETNNIEEQLPPMIDTASMMKLQLREVEDHGREKVLHEENSNTEIFGQSSRLSDYK